ncbi:hypothetical protein Ssi02_45290 [Sinosporangium siamense]|uniref:DUF4158 domain-containing protein n=1 Tax=Sinosporangium siamense TaxID=1367973 RepID=A0A919RIK3_9ACTN|nr:hypothetical protein Ssi02_45290 [Sinosporangium siamense]
MTPCERVAAVIGARIRLYDGLPGRGVQRELERNRLVTVRYLGCFLADPLKVPNEILDIVAARLGIEDSS